LRAFLYTYNP